jgi:hypothetical protein
MRRPMAVQRAKYYDTNAVLSKESRAPAERRAKTLWGILLDRRRV